jgi:GNAT superfamily N-acetyltransferase
MQLRDARPEERDMLVDLTLAAYEQYSATMSAEFWSGYRRSLIAAFDGESPAERIVAELDGKLVGAVHLYPATAPAYSRATVGAASAVWPEIRLLAVATAARGRGVATALMDECLRRARAAGASAVGLHTMDVMQVAVRMYERMGFVRTPETDFRPAPGTLVKGYRREL